MGERISMAARRERHEWECKALVSEEPTIRRLAGRWQVLRAGKWRDLDPVVQLETEAK